MNDEQTRARFESLLLPLMNDAYNLARWLMKNQEDATGAINGFIADGLFIGRQRSKTFLDLILDMAAEADGARRELED